jgi:uncharacterized protein (UPF0333 family)
MPVFLKKKIMLAVLVLVTASVVSLLAIEFAEQNITQAIRTPSSTGLIASSNMTARNNSQTISALNATSPALGNNITSTNNITETVPAPVTKNGNQTTSGNQSTATGNMTAAGNVALCRRCH